MSNPSKAKSIKKLPKSSCPRCFRCQKPVDKLSVIPDPNEPGRIIIDFQCHGESASQEISSEILEGKHGLSAYTAFSDFTSGLLPAGPNPKQATQQKGSKG